MPAMLPSDRLRSSGVVLPPPPAPVGAYVQAVRYGTVIRTTGQLPFLRGRLVSTGTVGDTVGAEAAAYAARIATINALAAAAEEAGGIDFLLRALALGVHINCAPGFTEHAAVADGASLVLLEVLGDAGRHVRTNVGSPALPLGSPVEVELTVECYG